MSKSVLAGSGVAIAAVLCAVLLSSGDDVPRQRALRPKRAPAEHEHGRALRAVSGGFRALGIARADFLDSGAPAPADADPADPLADLSRQERKLAERFRSGAGLRTGNFTVITADGAQPAPSGGGTEEGR